ncbi:MAG TPA: class I SAM-dependent methyltransferase [Clostridia bacterium]|jgi:SAM-dependent methyltransferase|nr:class I SAM-dependent methyltransferase [Clostridia bacterium]
MCFKKIFNNTGRPEGFLGKMMLKGMNIGHAKTADWGISQLKNLSFDRIVDIGCGGGYAMGELLRKYPNSKVLGVDYSPLSVEQSSKYNAKFIEEKRCKVVQGDVSNLNLEKEQYDLATAFETVYFWPGLEKCFKEVYDILKAGGTFMIVNESNGLDKSSLQFEKIIDGMKVYTADDISKALGNVGFLNIEVKRHAKKPWLTIIAKK